eukprot:638580-Pyramimonas_sp.AAC.1
MFDFGNDTQDNYTPIATSPTPAAQDLRLQRHKHALVSDCGSPLPRPPYLPRPLPTPVPEDVDSGDVSPNSSCHLARQTASDLPYRRRVT